MSAFCEQLSNARKAAGMTQEQLAAAVHVTRTTISSWERGRTSPAPDTLRSLSLALRYDFMNDRPMPDGEPPEVPGSQTPEEAGPGELPQPDPADAEPAPRRMRWILPACGCAAVLLVCFFMWILPRMNGRGPREESTAQPPVEPADTAEPTETGEPVETMETAELVEPMESGETGAAPEASSEEAEAPVLSGRDMSVYPAAEEIPPEDLLLKEPRRMPPEWFRQGNRRAAGEPWLDIGTFVRYEPADRGSTVDFWRYGITFEEVTGETFRLDQVDLYSYAEPTMFDHRSLSEQQVTGGRGGPLNSWQINGQIPVQDLLGFGYIIYGYDPAGNPMSFRAWIDMTDAPRE